MKKKKYALAAAALGLALSLGAVSTPAFALGGPVNNGGFTGASWVNPCTGPATCAYTFSNIGAATLTVQIRAGSIMHGPKIATTGSPATVKVYSTWYNGGARHSGNSTVFLT